MLETKRYWLFPLLIIAFAGFALTFSSTGKVGGAYIESNPALPLAPDRVVLIPQKSELAGEPVMSARAVLAKDINSDLLLFEKNGETVLPIASLTKLLTALLIYKKTGLSGAVTVEDSDVGVLPFTADLVPGERLRVDELVNVMLVASANDAAIVLARGASGSVESFVLEMNELAQELGMTSSSFTNPVGFDDPNHYSTAEDLTHLIDEFLGVPELRSMVAKKEVSLPPLANGKARVFNNTNDLLDFDERIKGVKTGYTESSRGSLIVLVDDPTHPYYLAVIGSQNREEEARKLIQWIEGSYQWE